MHKLLTALLVTLAVASVGAQAGTQAQKPVPPATPPAAQAQKPATPTRAPATPPATQPQKPAAPATPPAAQAPRPAAPARMSMTMFVTDPAGKPIADVKMSVIEGPVDRGGTTDKDGILKLAGIKPGTFRLRFEAKSFITFEREVTVKAGSSAEVEVTLNPSPAAVAPPPPAQPQTAPAQPSVLSPTESGGQIQAQYLADWIDQNLIGRNEPRKETVVGQAKGAVASVLQVRDPVKDRSNADADEFLYVIAGEGAVRFGGHTESVTAGWFVVVPRNTLYTVERRGRNPLVVLVVTAPRKP
jgi:mannose-6-phosphate isomerase-like protein (cupin superfamily)